MRRTMVSLAITVSLAIIGLAIPNMAGAAVGRTPAQFDVSPRGEATYRIPLSLPAGTNGLTPQLTLSYSSHFPNGWLGMGFTIPEFSMISRCFRTNAQDGGMGPFEPNFGTSDVFCIDANRLRLVSGTTYGAANTSYQTELESFRKITITGADIYGPTGFEVRNPDGRIFKYGTTVDSKIRLVTSGGALSSIRLHWALSRIEDRAGNAIEFSYAQDATRGGYWPTEIRYTSHNGGTTPLYKVVFVNDTVDRPDPILNRLTYTGTAASPKFEFIKRLARIDVVYIPTGGIIRRYELTYLPISSTVKHSLIQSIRECGAGGSDCLTPTMFNWNTPTLSQGGTVTGPSIPSGVSTHVMDLNGDLRTDLVWSSGTGSGTWLYALANAAGGFDPAQNTTIPNTGYANAAPIEWDGDGRLDLIFPGSDNTWKVLRSNGAGFDAPVSTGIAYNSVSGFADINGDSRDDLMCSNGIGAVKIRLNTGSGFGAETTGVSYVWPVVKIYSPPGAKRQDFDGDSLEDVVVQYDEITFGPTGGPVHTLKLKAIHGAGTALRLGTDYGATQYVGTGDFNGDKVTDVAYVLSGRIYTSLSTTAGPIATSAVIADWDGYGRDDLLFPSGGIYQYAPSLGTTFGTPTSTGVATLGNATTGDFDADGVADLTGVTSGSVKVVGHYSIVPWPLYGTMQSAKDGYDLNVTFDYKLVNDLQVHTVPLAPAFPMANVNSPLPLVRTLTANDGVTGTSTYSQTFKYENGRQHLLGRGFVGFTKRTIQDSRIPQLSVEEIYRQDFPYIGALDSRTLKQISSGLVVQKVTNTWTKLTYPSSREFPYISPSVYEQHELGGTYDGVKYSTTTRYVDAIDSASGLQTDVRVTIAENATGLYTGAVTTRRTLISSFMNDTPNWCLGRPQTIQQINSHTTMPGGTQLTRTSSATWDGINCRLQEQKVEPNNAQWEVTTAYGYDTFGNVNLTTVTPASGQGQGPRQTSVFWGADGRAPRATTNPKGHQTQLTWDFDAGTAACPVASAVLGQLRCVTDPNSLTTRFDYDAVGRLTREQRPDGTATTYSISACDLANNYCGVSGLDWNVSTVSRDTSNNAIRTNLQHFDGLNRLRYDNQQMLSGANSTVITNYDALGRTASQTTPYVAGSSAWNTYFSYDPLSRLTQTQRQTNENDTSTSTTGIAYQALRTITTDPLSHSSTAIRDATGRVVQMIDAGNYDTDYEYDVFGNLLKTHDYSNNEITLTYNVRGMKMTSNDPDMGNWTYNYFPLGELKTQTDAKTQVLQFTYDELSRPLTRIDQPEGQTTWEWDTATKGVGRLKSVTSPGGFGETYTYDSLGRAQTLATNIDGTNYTYTYGYHATQGVLQTLQYPNSVGTPFKVQYDYQNGQLQKVKDFNAPTTVFWEALATNARHQVIDEQVASSLRTINTYDLITGAINRIDAGYGGGSAEQQLRYTWNRVGSLIKREDLNQGTLNETLEYDALDRLDIVRRNGSMTLDMAYDAIGNITNKSDVSSSNYTYHATKKHAVTTAGANTYGYDPNGNVNSRNGYSVTWYSYNLPNQINTTGGKYAKFWYGADRQRYKQEHHAYVGAGTLRTTIYVGGLFEKVTDGSTTPYYRHYVIANGRTVAVHAKTDNAGTVVTWTAYPTRDHLGSTDAFLTGPTDVERRYSYDAFGKRRGTNWTGSPTNAELDLAWHDSSNRGFTGHEHLDNVGGLIHMNGRVYDPTIGRFMSADPLVQAPYYSQSLNRYSYVFNNPLTFTDPSGFCAEDVLYCWDFDLLSYFRWDTTRYRFHDPGLQRGMEEQIAAGKNVDGTKVPATVMAIQSHPILPYANGYEDLKTAANNWSNTERAGWNETIPEWHCNKAGCWRDPNAGQVIRRSITNRDLVRTGAEVVVIAATLGAATPEVVAARGGVAVGEAAVARTGAQITADEIIATNRALGGTTELTGKAETVIANMAYREGANAQAATAIRDIAGRHLFDDANKRTAQAIAEKILGSGANPAQIRSVIDRVGTGELRSVEDIAAALGR